MKVVQSYLEQGRVYAKVHINYNETVGELEDKLKAIDRIVSKTISDIQSGKKTMKTKDIEKIIHPLDIDYMKRLRNTKEVILDAKL